MIVPALRERENITPLTQRIAAALIGRRFEIIIVDDNSRDGTAELCAMISQSLPLRLIVRDVPTDGLSGAVLEGMRAAKGRTLVVMDADLQHPPEVIPALVQAIESGQSRFALGSRYVAGGGVVDGWGSFRKINSRVATMLARPFAHGVHDPMSGFFAISREAFEEGEFIAPTGYKIALELICKCRVGEVREVPIVFGLRERGQSKLTMREQFRYLEHLSRLYDFSFPRLVPAVKFLITISIAFLVASAVFLSIDSRDWWSVPLAYAIGIVPTAIFHLRYVRTQRAFLPRPRPWTDFVISSIAELIAVATAAAYLVLRAGLPTSFEVLAIAFGVGTVMRYLVRKELRMDVRGLRFR